MNATTEFGWWLKRDTDGDSEQGPCELEYRNNFCDEIHWYFSLQVEFDEEVPTDFSITESECVMWFQGKDYGDLIDHQNETREEFLKRVMPLLDRKQILKHAIVARQENIEANRDYQIDLLADEGRLAG